MSRSAWPSPPYRNTDLFSSYYLDDRIDSLDAWDCDEEAKEAFEQLCDLWELEKDLVDSYNEDELLDSWIDDVLNILGFGTLSETTLPDGSGYNDRLLFDSHEARRDAVLRRKNGDSEAMYNLASALLEAKQWNSDFTKRFSEERSYRDASQQTKFYLEHTPERLNWGILTDGRHWRLYGTKDYATETYYEVDLPKLLESGDVEQFKYFTRSSDQQLSMRLPVRRISTPFGTKARLLHRNSGRTCKTTFLLHSECLGRGSSKPTTLISILMTRKPVQN